VADIDAAHSGLLRPTAAHLILDIGLAAALPKITCVADVSVRPATPDDAPAVAAVQAESWKQTFAGTLPPAVLDLLRAPEAVEQWRLAVLEPPSRHHHLLVAEAGGDVVGFVALAPSSDPDGEAETDAEIVAIGVLPERLREGHGSRLVNAAVDHLRQDGFVTARVWVTGSDPLRPFLEGAGWEADGAHRSLDLHDDGTVVVAQVRLHTSIREPA
jgi:ribosomal protein S18 acetylase RimI-like enzyme